MRDDRAGRLYATHGPAIYARCLRLLGDRTSAEDATQETFLRVHRHLDDAPDDPRSLAWIYRIATNLCLTMIRDRKPQAELPEEIPAGRDVEALLANRLLAEQIIRKSDEKHRLPAWLRYVDGLSLEEVAEVLGVTSRTVTNRLLAFTHGARKILTSTPDD